MRKQSNLSSDEVRKKILELLDLRRKKARSLLSIQQTITDIKKGLREYNISQSEVVTNLDYLVQNGWVKEEKESRTFKSPRGFEFPSETRKYRLSDVGIKYIEGGSTFDTSNSFNGINITNMGGITVVGNSNIVQNEYLDIFRVLDQLENEVKLTDKIDDQKKLSTISDIRAIKSQLSKPIPDVNIVKAAIAGISFLGSIDGIISLYQKVEPLLKSLIH
ncbi:MAG: hypothetical protein NTV24_01180 [Candidatus Woesebacteria bacterium]|nr:hypothetical protein [Candidatus Woesebacteria bacterium]